MIIPEKNDVDISPLFSWSKETTIKLPNSEESLKIYIRLVGDAEINRARVYGLRKSAELRKKLKDIESDEYLAFIIPEDELDRESIENLIILNISNGLGEDAYKSINVPFPKAPYSDASLEEQENYQREVDEYPALVREKIREYIEGKVLKLKNELSSYDDTKLYKIYVREAINQLCELEMYDNFRSMCVYFGIYTDNKFEHRLFNSLEEFLNLPPQLKKELFDLYNSLEIGMDTIKK